MSPRPAGAAPAHDAQRPARPLFGHSVVASASLVIGFTAFLLVVIWGAVVGQIEHDRAAALETARVNTRNLARAYAEHVLGALQLVDQGLRRIKKEYENQSKDPEFLRRLMDDANVDARTVPIGITDEKGYIVASNLGVIPHANLPATASPAVGYAGDRDYFRAQANEDSDRVYVSAPLASRITGKTAVALSRRLNTPDGGFAGIVFASFDPDYLSGFFSDLDIGPNSSFAILGEDMIVRDLIRGTGRATDLVGKRVPNLQLSPALAQAPNGDYEAVSSLDGIARIYSYRALPNYRLAVVASAAVPEILAGYYERRSWLLWTAAALSVFLAAVGALQLRRIRESRRYEIALDRSNEKLARAQRLAGVGSFEHDVATGKAEWSDQIYRILGIEKTGTIPGPETLLALIHPEDRERFRKHRATELEGKATPPLEYRIIRPDGAERIVRRENAMVIDKETKSLRRYGTLQDITTLRLAEQRERELERRLLHSQKLEALGTLAGGIAHDLNNTLTPIMALSKLAARRLEAGSAVRDHLETIFAASEQARDLVRRVLSFSRRDKVEKILASPSPVVNDALLLLRATLPSSIHFVTRIAAVPSILADPSQIHQVVTNLVANAAQAIEPNSGTITVILENVAEDADAIRLSVIDTGKGMDEGTRRRIFEPFFTTKDVGQGTGLGLSIIEGIVNDHGGRIEVASEPGKGTRFDVYFPIAAPETAAAPPTALAVDHSAVA